MRKLRVLKKSNATDKAISIIISIVDNLTNKSQLKVHLLMACYPSPLYHVVFVSRWSLLSCLTKHSFEAIL